MGNIAETPDTPRLPPIYGRRPAYVTKALGGRLREAGPWAAYKPWPVQPLPSWQNPEPQRVSSQRHLIPLPQAQIGWAKTCGDSNSFGSWEVQLGLLCNPYDPQRHLVRSWALNYSHGAAERQVQGEKGGEGTARGGEKTALGEKGGSTKDTSRGWGARRRAIIHSRRVLEYIERCTWGVGEINLDFINLLSLFLSVCCVL